jgi:aldose 1-epimerase
MSREILLQSGDLVAGIAPGSGGSVSRFSSEHEGIRTNWMRPASAAALAAGGPQGMGCFPLVPFSNRIRNGRFQFQDKSVQLPLNFGDHPHSIHGHGWENAWTIEQQTPNSLVLGYDHKADAWPWTYRAGQIFKLDDTSLTIDLSLSNESDADMPAGLGLHPYFPRSDSVTITASVAAMWQVNDEVMPVKLVEPLSSADPNSGLNVTTTILDNGFTGWQKSALIRWPERERGLVMTATGPLDHLVIFTPEGQDFFCVEPVSHSTDAVNVANPSAGMISLPPGETVAASVKFEIT